MNLSLFRNAAGGAEFTNLGAIVFFGVVAFGVWFLDATRPEPAYQPGTMVKTVLSGDRGQIISTSCKSFYAECDYTLRIHNGRMTFKGFEFNPVE